MQLTRDGGKSWTNLSAKLPACPEGSWIPQIEVSLKNAGEAFVVVNNYRRNDWKPYVYHTTDFGNSWTRIVDENKVKGHALSIVQDPVVPELLFLGTDYGLYFSIDGGKIWNKWTEGFPSVSTRDLKIHPREHDLIIGTFGRAAWILDDIRPLRDIAKTQGKILEQPFKVFEPRDAYILDFRSVDGIRFVADGEFIGQNKGSGAVISIWTKPEKKKKDKKEEKSEEEKSEEIQKEEREKPKKGKDKKKLYVTVYDESGDTTYYYSTKADTSFYRISWNMRRIGESFPSYRERKPTDNPPRGSYVLPGKYKIVIEHKDYKDSTFINVKSDPRSSITIEQMKAEKAALDDFYKIVKKARAAFEQLKQAKKTIKLVDNQMVNASDSVKTNIAKQGKAMQDSIKSLMGIFLPPQNQKGIVRNNNTLSTYLYRASSYIGNSDGPPSQMAQIATENAKKETEKALDAVNQFFEKDWSTYQKNAGSSEAFHFLKLLNR